MEHDEAVKFINDAIENSDLPHIYANGLTVSIGVADVAVVLRYGEQAVAVINLSHIVAKTMAQVLGNVIATFEEQTGTTVLTTQEVRAILQKSAGEKNATE